MSYGGFNPGGSSELPFSNPNTNNNGGMRSRASSVSSVHSNQGGNNTQYQQQSSPYQSPYGSRPGTPVTNGEGFFGSSSGGGGVSSNGGYGGGGSSGGYDGYESGCSSPGGTSYMPTPPVPNQQRQQRAAGSSYRKKTAGPGYDSPTTGVSSSTFYSHHSRTNSNASETSLNIDTGALGGGRGGDDQGPYSPGLSALSSASSSRRSSFSDNGSTGGFFSRKSGKTFRPEPHQSLEDYMTDDADQYDDPKTTKAKKNSGREATKGGRRQGRVGVREIFNDWDLLLPSTDPYEDEEDDDDDELNEDEKWKKRQLSKKGWESTRGQVILISLLVIMAIFVRIWKLAVPGAVVFDEQHFGGFAADYLRGEFIMDIHPPLGKMLYAGVAYMLGFNGNFEFVPGRLYSRDVPYIGMRMFAVACGVGLIPISYLTIKKSGHSTQAAMICAILVTFENAMTIFSRLGFLAIADGIFFVLVKQRDFSKQFTVLFICLLIFPAGLYLGLHAIDFRLLSKSGSGNAWVSPQFQMTLKGHDVMPVMADIAWDSKVHIRHANTNGGWVHTMPGEYTRDGSKDQAIQLVEWDDDLTCWQIFPADPQLRQKHAQHKQERKEDPSIEFDGYVYDGDKIRLRHCYSKVALAINDIESLGSNKTFFKEVRGFRWTKQPTEESVWRVELVPEGLVAGLAEYSGPINKDGAAPTSTENKRSPGKQWHSIKGFRLWNDKLQCYLQSHKVFRAPYSTYQEVTCVQGERQKSNTIFVIDQNVNNHLPKSTPSISYQPLTFMQKFLELNRVMWWTHHDLSAPIHGDGHSGESTSNEESRPWSWPLMRRGLNYYSSRETNHYVHFMGNPLLWWSASATVGLYMISCLWSTIKFLKGKTETKIERDRFGITPFYAVASGTFFAGWAIHYIPFFFMSRQVFLHHYLPALYFSILLLVSRLDRTLQKMPSRIRYLVGIGIMAAIILSFYSFSPFAYGTDFGSSTKCESLRALGGWKFTCQRQELAWARPESAMARMNDASAEQDEEDDDDESHFYDWDEESESQQQEQQPEQQQQQQQQQQQRDPEAEERQRKTTEAETMAKEAQMKQQKLAAAEKEASELKKKKEAEEKLASQEKERKQKEEKERKLKEEKERKQKEEKERKQKEEKERKQKEQQPKQPQQQQQTKGQTREELEEQIRILEEQLRQQK
ncbi:hypothetical protein BGZ76_009933 [Entomortierella beljakovae]|nr:hypothetical protein BGZ76_009933 [Entomortierella beljakovae]